MNQQKTTELLREIEGRLRSLSTDIWIKTVDDPDTATVESEAAGMTADRLELRGLMARVDALADWVESEINDPIPCWITAPRFSRGIEG